MLAFELRRPHHAIGEFVATVELFQPVSPATFTGVVELAAAKAAELNLPAPIPTQVFSFNVGGSPGGVSLLQSGQAAAGHQRFSALGEVEESLLCDQRSIIFTCRNYISWAATKPRLLKLFADLLEAYTREVPAIANVRLQYLNEFRAGDGAVTSVREVLREGSRWIPPFSSQVEEPWHSHVGLYTEVTDNRRLLGNVNCDVQRAAPPGSTSEVLHLSLFILAGCYFNIPGAPPLVLTPGQITSTLDSVLETCHDLEKSILAENVSHAYLKAIGAIDARD